MPETPGEVDLQSHLHCGFFAQIRAATELTVSSETIIEGSPVGMYLLGDRLTLVSQVATYAYRERNVFEGVTFGGIDFGGGGDVDGNVTTERIPYATSFDTLVTVTTLSALIVLQANGSVIQPVGSLHNRSLGESIRSVRYAGDRVLVSTGTIF